MNDIMELASIFFVLALVAALVWSFVEQYGQKTDNAIKGPPRVEWSKERCVINNVQYRPTCPVNRGCGCDMTWGVPLTGHRNPDKK